MRNSGNANIGKEIAEIVAATYSNINDVCRTRKLHLLNPAAADIYARECQGASTLIDRVVAHILDPGIVAKTDFSIGEKRKQCGSKRLSLSVPRLGWKLIAICVHAEAFRRACKEAGDVVWNGVVDQIDVNRSSIEIFARIRNLDWRGPLLMHSRYLLRDLQREFAPYRKLYHEHPHHYVRTKDRELRWPMYENHRQKHIDACVFDANDWKRKENKEGWVVDPTRRRYQDGVCESCFRDGKCACRPNSHARQLVELREYPVRGIGVRALANFKKGDILDEFVGLIKPTDYQDHKYAITIDAGREAKDGVFISPKRFGNWTRFINHSCDAAAEFKRMTVGDRVVIAIIATRDIFLFEEITVNYGEDYWAFRMCECGAPNCLTLMKALAAGESLPSPCTTESSG